jgi:cytochrome c oxidase subunit 3
VSLTVAVIALAAGVLVWVLLATRLTARPWESPGGPESATGHELTVPPARVALWIFLAVITSLFGLFISAYYMRMEHAHDGWSPLVVPRVLWLNSALLIGSSAGMQWARGAAERGQPQRLWRGLIVGGLFAWSFLAGQLLAWHELSASGHWVASSPATSFFYLLTGVHGLHLLGGLFVWSKTVVRMSRSRLEVIDVRPSVELCTVYWHYLLVVWLVIFAVLLST